MEVFTIRMTLASIVMMVSFINLHTKLAKFFACLEIFVLNYTPSNQIYEYLTNSPQKFDYLTKWHENP